MENILEEAQRIVHGDRQGDYGHPLDNWSLIAQLWSAILGFEVTAEQHALCMIAVKIARERNKPKRDNLVDVAGYAAALELVAHERVRRDAFVKACDAALADLRRSKAAAARAKRKKQ